MYFDKVDRGERVVVRRGKYRSYVLTALPVDDSYFNEDMLNVLKESILEVEQGETLKITTSSEISELLGL
ncbi:prevent-host-death protein [Cryomorpha ignava]|uniref:Prevent-host-death protein n=1 Tax=Cryomorpha ignava TaxID=101383 RepID=A0A7K3WVT2_9FLAO|nr:prevent-host-death protein [Cryomorpha ignava]NEN25161.1 prevent-host-death protein [Cryomorpha ignava]